MSEFLLNDGTLYSEMAGSIRYVVPSSDTNRARWQTAPFWCEVQANLAQGLAEMNGALPASRVREIARADLIDLLDKQILGCEATLAAAHGFADVETCDLANFAADRVQRQIESDPGAFHKKISKAADRYYFLDDSSAANFKDPK